MASELQRRAKLSVKAPSIPMEVRAEKALEAIYVCCFGEDLIEDEDQKLLQTMLSAVFPSVQQSQIESMIHDKARRVAEGEEEGGTVPKPKPLPREAVQLQMKDLQFLRQNSESWVWVISRVIRTPAGKSCDDSMEQIGESREQRNNPMPRHNWRKKKHAKECQFCWCSFKTRGL